MSDLVMLSLDLPASHRYLNVLGACIAEMLQRIGDHPPSENQIYELQLAAQEVSTNIVKHAYVGREGRIHVHLSYDSAIQQFGIIFTDTGDEFNSYDEPPHELVASEQGGMGLFLIKALVDEMHYQRVNETNIWRIAKKLN